MVEADSHLKQLPMFGQVDMLSIDIQYQPYIVIPTLLGSDFGVLGHL